jgi:hypothetical protein
MVSQLSLFALSYSWVISIFTLEATFWGYIDSNLSMRREETRKTVYSRMNVLSNIRHCL